VTTPLASSRPAVGSPAASVARRQSWRRRSKPARVVRALCLCALLVPALVSFRPYAVEDRIRAAARPYDFDLIAWEAGQLHDDLPSLIGRLREPPPADAPVTSTDDAATVDQFFAAVARWRTARATGGSAESVAAARAAWESQRDAAGAAIERALSALASQEGLTADTPLGTWLLPPVSFQLTEPPRVLVVSPRDRIEVAQSVLLRPDVSLSAAEELEQHVDSLGMSGLVVTIGGIATYPAIVPLQASPLETLTAVSHEWLHGYLFFRPLGRAYFTSYDARMVNETVAELGGRELGKLLAEAFGLPADTPAPTADTGDTGGFDFRRQMRDTRQQLDALLASGQIAEAEEYLARRQQDFVAAGYPIRKLNQAYFAFHGSYGDSPASVSPLDGQIQTLRDASPDLGAFLRRVAQMTSSAEVAAAAEETPPGS